MHGLSHNLDIWFDIVIYTQYSVNTSDQQLGTQNDYIGQFHIRIYINLCSVLYIYYIKSNNV